MSNINEKHLEFLQGVINRHNSNSFLIKGWTITISSAIYALTGTIKEPHLAFIAIGPILMFWVLDSMFLANERCFVSLYSCVSKGNSFMIETSKLRKKIRKDTTDNEKEYTVSDFSMNFVQFREVLKNNWWSVMFSYTIRWFYITLSIVTILTFYGLKFVNSTKTQESFNVNATIITSDTLNINPIDIKNTISVSDTLFHKRTQDTKPTNNKIKH